MYTRIKKRSEVNNSVTYEITRSGAHLNCTKPTNDGNPMVYCTIPLTKQSGKSPIVTIRVNMLNSQLASSKTDAASGSRQIGSLFIYGASGPWFDDTKTANGLVSKFEIDGTESPAGTNRLSLYEADTQLSNITNIASLNNVVLLSNPSDLFELSILREQGFPGAVRNPFAFNQYCVKLPAKGNTFNYTRKSSVMLDSLDEFSGLFICYSRKLALTTDNQGIDWDSEALTEAHAMKLTITLQDK